MKNHEQLSQKIGNAVKSDPRIAAAMKQILENEDEIIEAWGGIIKRRVRGASVRDTFREMVPLEMELFKLKVGHFNLMKEVFDENKTSYGLLQDADFLDFFIHPLDDQELMKTIENLIRNYKKMWSYKKKIKKLIKKMGDTGLEYINLNGSGLVTSTSPRDILLIAEGENLKMGYMAYFVDIERLKISMELSALGCRDLGEWLLDLLKTLPITKITKELTPFFESLIKFPTKVS